jgi:hypothetical protein
VAVPAQRIARRAPRGDRRGEAAGAQAARWNRHHALALHPLLDPAAEIRQQLLIGEATAKTHVTRIPQKLDLRDRVQAVIDAYETKLVASRLAALTLAGPASITVSLNLSEVRSLLTASPDVSPSSTALEFARTKRNGVG